MFSWAQAARSTNASGDDNDENDDDKSYFNFLILLDENKQVATLILL